MKPAVTISMDAATFLRSMLRNEIGSVKIQDAMNGTTSIGHLGTLEMYLKSLSAAIAEADTEKRPC